MQQNNPKAYVFYATLFGMATCTAFAYGPQAGIAAFGTIAIVLFFLG